MKKEVNLKGKTSMRTNNHLPLIQFFRSVVTLTIFIAALETKVLGMRVKKKNGRGIQSLILL